MSDISVVRATPLFPVRGQKLPFAGGVISPSGEPFMFHYYPVSPEASGCDWIRDIEPLIACPAVIHLAPCTMPITMFIRIKKNLIEVLIVQGTAVPALLNPC